MAGAGLAGFGGTQTTVSGKSITRTYGFTAAFAGAFGGGLDVRLSRLMSLRGEVRDFITERGLDGMDGINHVVFGFGIGFHW
jgi:hypothetical protein